MFRVKPWPPKREASERERGALLHVFARAGNQANLSGAEREAVEVGGQAAESRTFFFSTYEYSALFSCPFFFFFV